jgi:hypothetical protein
MFGKHLTLLKPFAAGHFRHIGLDVGVKLVKSPKKKVYKFESFKGKAYLCSDVQEGNRRIRAHPK